jgi:hypothetical protein
MRIIGSLLLIAYCVSSRAQTNSAPAAQKQVPAAVSEPIPQAARTNSADVLQLPATTNRMKLELSAPQPKHEKSLLDDFATIVTSFDHEATTLDNEQAIMLRYHERLNRSGYLAPQPRSPYNLFTRTVDAIFQPEPMRMGKTTVTFTPITAIKRKNPLALLNPFVLNISW